VDATTCAGSPSLRQALQQVRQFIGVFFFHGQDAGNLVGMSLLFVRVDQERF
jgi:hypothetical protein